MTRSKLVNRSLTLVVLVAALGLGFLAWKATRPKTAAYVLPTEVVERHNITVTIEATGTVEPIDLVEVKSKASGQILKMPVEVGSKVQVGNLLALIDTVDASNQYAQALAALRAAEARSTVSHDQLARTTQLFNEQVITKTELESAQLDEANSRSALVKARTDLDSARQRREDTTVRAPVSGTILEQVATLGQVIASATSSVSGGTTLLKMADLSRLRLRTLVAESDIGKVAPGMKATVTVDAYPDRPFAGIVEKIEPQAVVQQSVTMFPVLISISNEQGLLLPGMNGEVTVRIEERLDVTAVPLDAVRTVRELSTIATALGVNPDSARADLQRQLAQRRAALRARAGGDSAAAPGGRERGSGAGGDRSSMRGPGSGTRGSANGGTGRPVSSPGTGDAGGSGTSAASNSRAQFVYVKSATGLSLRLVRIGLFDYDYAEVLRGVEAGESVVLLNVAELQAMRLQAQDRMRQRVGTGLPGGQTSGRTSGGTRTGGGR